MRSGLPRHTPPWLRCSTSSTFMRKLGATALCCATLSAAVLLGATRWADAANLVLKIEDAPGTGFYDPAPVAPLADNPGKTLGEQRLHVFRFATDLWGKRLQSNVPIVVRAWWAYEDCRSGRSVSVGGGSVAGYFRDFRKAPRPG